MMNRRGICRLSCSRTSGIKSTRSGGASWARSGAWRKRGACEAGSRSRSSICWTVADREATGESRPARDQSPWSRDWRHPRWALHRLKSRSGHWLRPSALIRSIHDCSCPGDGARAVIAEDVELGEHVVVPHPELVNLYGCKIGDNCKIASFVEIQQGVVLGKNVKVEAFAFIPSGLTIEDGAFIGPHVCFTNDRNPRAVDEEGHLLGADDWAIVPTLVRRGASIGANATIVCGVTIGE